MAIENMSGYERLSDQELMSRLKERDYKAFEAVYDRYWGLLLRHALRMLEDQDEAKDAIQDVFTMLWTKAADLQVETLSSFLYASVRNRILDLIDRSKVRQSYVSSLASYQPSLESSAEDLHLEEELARRIEQELGMLPRKMREIFELSRIQEYSYDEISNHLNISQNTVKKQISNALKILRRKFKAYLFGLF